ncbi:hypothetical protein PWT90_10949 [Aphanocladium album]|nr:hypothetical protein PWT90_10949 [Aphanocladium album]
MIWLSRLWVLFLLTFVFASSGLVYSRNDDGIDPRPALGFHLGQSYGTAAAHFSNGTILSIAKIESWPAYRDFLQHKLLRQTGIRFDPWRPQTWWKSFVVPPKAYVQFGGAAVLAKMLRALRIASEEVLGAPLPETVGIGVPYVLAWREEESSDIYWSAVRRARESAELPNVIFENMEPSYIAEANAILAANGQQLCQNRYCFGPMLSHQRSYTHETIYLITLTDQSLYTSFQAATCFFHSPINACLGTINFELGLLREASTSDKQIFWHKFEDYLVARWVEHARNGDDYHHSYTLVLAGEGAPNPNLQRVVDSAIERLKSGIPGTGPPANFTLLISEEPTFAGARGVAFWRRSMMDRKYCVD